MPRNILVTPEELNSAASKIQGLAAEYKTMYEKLYSENNAMASTWNGKDNLAYIEQIAGFKDDFDRMHSLMLSYADYLIKSARAYKGVLDSVTSEANKLPIDSSTGGVAHGGGGASFGSGGGGGHAF